MTKMTNAVEDFARERYRGMGASLGLLREGAANRDAETARAALEAQDDRRKLRDVSAERDSMARRIKAAEALCNGPMTHDWDEVRERFSQIAKALETPDAELPF